MATIRKRGRKYYVEVCVNGYRKGKTLNTRKEAREWGRIKEQELSEHAPSDRTLRQAVDKYLAEIAVYHKGHRKESQFLARIVDQLPDLPLSDLTKGDIAAWKVERLQVVSSASVRREMTVLSQVIKAAIHEWGWIGKNPMEGVKRPADSRPRRRGLAQEEIDGITQELGYIEGVKPWLKKQEVAIAFLLAIETGMRAGELLALTWKDIDLEACVAVLQTSKNQDARQVPLSGRARALLSTLPQEQPHERVFRLKAGSLDALFRKAKIAAGFPDVHFHDSRSEALTRLSKKLDVLELARVIGHRDTKSLMIYYSATASDMAKKLD